MPCVALVPHPATPCSTPASIEVELETGACLRLHYRLRGDSAALAIPAPAAPARTDGLWRHTCCELFVGSPDDPSYREFNFAPSGQWAAYGFTACREGMYALEMPAPHIAARAGPDGFHLQVELDPRAAGLDGPRKLLGLSCVIESMDGALSYWALTHPAARPDFHHRGGFALALESAGTT